MHDSESEVEVESHWRRAQPGPVAPEVVASVTKLLQLRPEARP
jgi:hypothetical protein